MNADNMPLADVVAAALALSSALERVKRQAGDGAHFRDYPLHLERALSATLDAWQRTAAGRAALGLAPLPSADERLRQTAAADLHGAERQLAGAKAIRASDAATLGDRKKRIEAAAEHVALSRRRLAELSGDSTGYQTWLRSFLGDVKQAVADAVIERPSLAALLERDRADNAAALDREDRLGALARAAGL